MLTNGHIVGYMHKVIDLGALADDGVAERSAIDGCIGPYLHVVVKDHFAKLQDFAVARLVEHIAETVRADDRAGVNGDAVADLALRINDGIL